MGAAEVYSSFNEWPAAEMILGRLDNELVGKKTSMERDWNRLCEQVKTVKLMKDVQRF